MKIASLATIIAVGLGLILLGASAYVVSEGQQIVITQFGDPVRDVTDAGLYWKIPFIQEVHRLDKRLLPWDGDPQNMPTKDKRLIDIDVWASRYENPESWMGQTRFVPPGEYTVSIKVGDLKAKRKFTVLRSPISHD